MEFYLNGNTHYAAGDCDKALQSYSSGLQVHQQKDELQAKLLLNRAQCFLRKEQYSEASKDCSLVIGTFGGADIGSELQILVLKGYLRRAQAHEYLGNYSKALTDVERTLSLEPPVSLRKTAVAARSKLKTFVDVDHKVSLSEGRPKMMVTDQQALRLAFIEQPPEIFIVGEPYLIRLCITNELGLWDRDFIRRSFAPNPGNPHSARLECIANMQCEMSVFDLSEKIVNPDESGSGIVMDMQTSQSAANSSPLSIGEDGKVIFLQ